MRRLRHIVWLIPILLLAFGLRVWGLTEHNIWWDEGIGVWVARLPLLEGIRWTATDSHPPLHYAILRGWWLIAGEGGTAMSTIYVLRFPSVIAGLFTVIVTYKLGRLLGGTTTGILAALLMAISRFSIIWSQEIRMYGLATTLTTGSLWSAVWLWRTTGRPRSAGAWRAWCGYVGCTAAALFTLYLTGTVLAVTNLAFLVVAFRQRWHRRSVWLWVTAQVAVVALVAPWLLYALPRMHSLSTDDPFDPGFFLQLYATMLTVGSPLNLEKYVPWIVTALVGLILGVTAIIWRIRKRSVDEAQQVFQSGGLTMLLVGLLLPPLAVVVVALPELNLGFSRSVAPRYLLPLSACYTVLLAWGGATMAGRSRLFRHRRLDTLRRILGVAISTTVILGAVIGLTSFYPGRARRDDYVTIAEILRNHRHPTDAVVLYVDRDWPIFAAHYEDARENLPYGADFSDLTYVDTVLGKIWETATAIWLVATPESQQADPLQHVPQWLAAQAAVTQTLVDGENTLTLYARSERDAQVRQTMLPGRTLPHQVTAAHSLVGVHLPLLRYRTGDTLRLGLYWIPPIPEGTEVQIDNEHSRARFTIPRPTADLNIVRSQVDIPLTSELSEGEYQISLKAPGYTPTPVGTFKLIAVTVDEVDAATQIPHRTDVQFGDAIALVGYALPTTTVAPGGTVDLTLYWRTDVPLTDRYKVFTHLRGEVFNAATDNFLWGQQDNEPGNGQLLTTLWAPGRLIRDSYRIPVDPQAPPGTYALEVGMYGLVHGNRLPVSAQGLSVDNDALLLATIIVQ
jgi:4-amino-4-deoxy-L-arabinose transferase-like glycosyltransferase